MVQNINQNIGIQQLENKNLQFKRTKVMGDFLNSPFLSKTFSERRTQDISICDDQYSVLISDRTRFCFALYN